MGYEPSADKGDCVLKHISSRVKAYSYIYLAVMALGIIANVGSAYMYGSSWISSFGVIYQLQVMMMLPAAGVDFGEHVLQFYRMIYHLFFSFTFLPSSVTFFTMKNIVDYFEFPQTNWYLFALEFTDGSTIVNTRELLSVFLVIGIVYCVSGFSYSFTKEQEPDTNRFKYSKKAYDFVASSLVMRVVLLSYMFMLIASLSELSHTKRISKGVVSYGIACAMAGG